MLIPVSSRSRSRTPRWMTLLRQMSPLLAVVAVFFGTLSALGQPKPDPAPAGTAVNAAPGANAEAGPVPVVQKDPSLWELFLKGGTVMWVLAFSSVIAVAIIFERIFALRKNRIIPPGFVDGLKNIYRDPTEDRQRALDYCKSSDSPMARMVTAFVKRLPMGFPAAEKALEDAGGNEALKLRSNMRMLYAIGSVATLLGLIGTIAGMIKAFITTAKAGNAENKVELLSTGIYEAMVCTFGGLAVAIVVTVAYYYFIGRIEKLVGEINDELTRFSDEYGLNAESESELGVTSPLGRVR